MQQAHVETVRQDPLWPSDITIHQHTRTIDFLWGGNNASLTHRELRQSCRCGDCENLRRAGHDFSDIPIEVTLVQIEPIGETGLRFFFNDGHDRGIFPWAYLHHLAFMKTSQTLNH